RTKREFVAKKFGQFRDAGMLLLNVGRFCSLAVCRCASEFEIPLLAAVFGLHQSGGSTVDFRRQIVGGGAKIGGWPAGAKSSPEGFPGEREIDQEIGVGAPGAIFRLLL